VVSDQWSVGSGQWSVGSEIVMDTRSGAARENRSFASLRMTNLVVIARSFASLRMTNLVVIARVLRFAQDGKFGGDCEVLRFA
jgi:hypothetical protein